LVGATSFYRHPLYAGALREFCVSREGVRRIKASNPPANPGGIRTPFVGEGGYRKRKGLGSREIPSGEGPGSGLIPNATEKDKFEMSPRGVKADLVALMFLL
jgi:hypothetical protein